MSTKVIAELTIFPIGVGISLSKYVKGVIRNIEKFNKIRIQHHPMGTVIEADTIDQILEVTKLAHNSLFEMGAERVYTQLKIDDRRDKERLMEDKISTIH